MFSPYFTLNMFYNKYYKKGFTWGAAPYIITRYYTIVNKRNKKQQAFCSKLFYIFVRFYDDYHYLCSQHLLIDLTNEIDNPLKMAWTEVYHHARQPYTRASNKFNPICQSSPNTVRRMMRNDWNDYITRNVKRKTWQSMEQFTSPLRKIKNKH